MKKNNLDDRLKKNNSESDEKPEIYAVNNVNDSPGINRRDFLAKSFIFPIAATVGLGGILAASGCKKDDDVSSDYKSKYELSYPVGTLIFLGVSSGYNVLISRCDSSIVLWNLGDWSIQTTKSIKYDGYVKVNTDLTLMVTTDPSTLGSCFLWSLPDVIQLHKFPNFVDSIKSFAFNPQSDLLATSVFQDKIYLHRIPECTTYKIINGKGNVLFSPDGNYLISGDGQIWQMPEGSYYKSIEVDLGDLALISIDNTLVTANKNTIQFWNFPDGSLIKTINAHSNFIELIALRPDNKLIVSCANNEIKLWTFPEGNFIRDLSGHSGRVNSLLFSPDGSYLYSVSHDYVNGNFIKVWAIPSGEPSCLCDTVCTCNTVSFNNGTDVCTCNSIHTCTCNLVCTCNAVETCSCVSACSCDGDSSSHYWYPS